MRELSEDQLQYFVDSLLAQELSANTVRLIFTILKQSLNEAVRQKYIPSNPCTFVQLPKHNQTEVSALSIKEQKQLEKLAFQDSDCSPIILALYSGLRIGEISGLRWTDIDFEQNLIRWNGPFIESWMNKIRKRKPSLFWQHLRQRSQSEWFLYQQI